MKLSTIAGESWPKKYTGIDAEMEEGKIYNYAIDLCDLTLVLDTDALGFLIYSSWNEHLSETMLHDNWTAKHIQTESKTKSSEFAQALAQSANQFIKLVKE